MPEIVNDGISKRCDCGRRRWPKCTHGWHFGFHHNGVEYRLSLTKIAQARGLQPAASKSEAIRDQLRTEIRLGTFVDPNAPRPAVPVDLRPVVHDVMKLYVDGHVKVASRKPAGQVVMEAYINRLGPMHLPAAKRKDRPAQGEASGRRDSRRSGRTASGLDTGDRRRAGWLDGSDRALKRLRHFYNWSIEKGYTERSPFKRGHVNTIHFAKESGRTRRL
jgi:hypothetical protein